MKHETFFDICVQYSIFPNKIMNQSNKTEENKIQEGLVFFKVLHQSDISEQQISKI